MLVVLTGIILMEKKTSIQGTIGGIKTVIKEEMRNKE